MVAPGSKLGKARLRDMLCSRIGYAYGYAYASLRIRRLFKPTLGSQLG